MDTELLRRAGDVFLAACELDGPARDAYLDETCGDDAELRTRVESMLRADASSHTLLDGSVLDVLPEIDDETTVAAEVPQQIGSYRLEGEIDRGGMGTVHLAVHERTHRFVAIKVIRAGLATSQMLHRFGYEARLLARLHHPGIAQIFEASTYDSGHGPQPYLVMELVEGLPLLRYVRARKVRTRRRLELMLRLCDAVQHAHQKGVIHRDLKPNNILVTEDEQPKILDFGVARDIEVDTAGAQTLVDVQQVAGTVPYMAPEQILGHGDDVDTRCDVYALGVIGYQLLSGQLPYALDGKSIAEAARIIRDDEPDKLGAYRRRFRGDIENIIDKALSKRKDERYPTAQSLGNDIRRYLNDEPITAQRPPATTRARKFVRRHKTFVGGVIGTIVALALGMVGMWWEQEKFARKDRALIRRNIEVSRAEARHIYQAEELERRAAEVAQLETDANVLHHEAEQAAIDAREAEEAAAAARATAERERLRALASAGELEQVVRFMVELVDTTSTADLDRAVPRLIDDNELEPTTRALLHDALGVAYAEAGRTTAADEQFTMSLEVFERAYDAWRAQIPPELLDEADDAPLAERYTEHAGEDVPRLGLYARGLMHEAHHLLATGRPRLADRSAATASLVLRDLYGAYEPPQSAPALVRAAAAIETDGVAAARRFVETARLLPERLAPPTPREEAMLALVTAEVALHDGDLATAQERYDRFADLRPELAPDDALIPRHDEFATRLFGERGDHQGRSNALLALYRREVASAGPTAPSTLDVGVEVVEAMRLANRFMLAEDVLGELLREVQAAQGAGGLAHVDAEWTAARHVDLAGLMLDRATSEAVSTARMHSDLALAELAQLSTPPRMALRRARILHGRVLVADGEADAAIPFLDTATRGHPGDDALDVERRRLALETLYDLHATRARWAEAERTATALVDVARLQEDALRRAGAAVRLADALGAQGRHVEERAALRDAEQARLEVYGDEAHPEVTEISDRLESLAAMIPTDRT